MAISSRLFLFSLHKRLCVISLPWKMCLCVWDSNINDDQHYTRNQCLLEYGRMTNDCENRGHRFQPERMGLAGFGCKGMGVVMNACFSNLNAFQASIVLWNRASLCIRAIKGCTIVKNVVEEDNEKWSSLLPKYIIHDMLEHGGTDWNYLVFKRAISHSQCRFPFITRLDIH